MRKGRPALAAMSTLMCLSVARARGGADASPQVVEKTLEVSACAPGPDREAFVTLMRLELAGEALGVFASGRLTECDLRTGRVTLHIGDTFVPVSVADAPPEVRLRVLVVALVQTLRVVEPTESAAAVISAPAGKVKRTARDSAPASFNHVRDSPDEMWGLDAGVQVSIWGPLSTTASGANVGLYRRAFHAWRVAASLGYLTASHDSGLGFARVHILPLSGRVEREWGTNPAFRLGLGVQWSAVFVAARSRWGVEESSAKHTFGAGELRATLVIPAPGSWALTVGADVTHSVLGLKLLAGAEPGLSFYGIGGQIRCGAEFQL